MKMKWICYVTAMAVSGANTVALAVDPREPPGDLTPALPKMELGSGQRSAVRPGVPQYAVGAGARRAHHAAATQRTPSQPAGYAPPTTTAGDQFIEKGRAGELYDLADDPAETTDLFAKRPDVVAEIGALLAGVRAKVQATAKTP